MQSKHSEISYIGIQINSSIQTPLAVHAVAFGDFGLWVVDSLFKAPGETRGVAMNPDL
jgi:hypothetical protein